MPTKKKPKAKRRTSSKDFVAIDPRKYPVVAPPATQITAPYAYIPSRDVSPYAARPPERIGGVDSGSVETASGTKTTSIGVVASDCILLNYNLSAGVWGGTFSAPIRFRVDIERGGTAIFSVNCMVAAAGNSAAIASNAEIVLKTGDVVKLVCVRTNFVNVTWTSAAQLMLQPYQ